MKKKRQHPGCKLSKTCVSESSRDQHFNALGTVLAKNIYGSYKGQLRLALLREDLTDRIRVPMRILDVGAGMAQLSAEWAAAGCDVHAFDAAPAMRQAAQEYFYDTFGLDWGERYRVAQWQDYTLCDGSACEADSSQVMSSVVRYDWVFCHAVLAWLSEPEVALKRITSWCSPGGHVSLLFFNKDSIVLRQVFRGRFDYLEKMWRRLGESPDGVLEKAGQRPEAYSPQTFYTGGLTPQTPLNRCWVYDQLDRLGFEVLFEAGVRCFSDYMPTDVRDRLTFTELLEIERVYRVHMPFLGMARYIHVIARKRDTSSLCAVG